MDIKQRLEFRQKLEARKEDYLTMLEQALERQKLNDELIKLLDKMLNSIQERIDILNSQKQEEHA